MIIEETILNCLLEADIDGVGENVYCETPLYPQEEYILIEKTAGGEENLVRTAMVAVQSISKWSLYRAMEMNEAVLEAMKAFGESSGEVFACRLNSNYNFTNTKTKEYRYQAVFDITY